MKPPVRDWLDYLTLTIAVVGLLSGAIALVWQVMSFRLTGSFVVIRVLDHVRKMRWELDEAEGEPRLKIDTPVDVISISIYNKGRTPVTVERFLLVRHRGLLRTVLTKVVPSRVRWRALRNEEFMVFDFIPGMTFLAKFPHQLPPGQNPLAFYLERGPTERAIATSGRWQAMVFLGDGSSRRGGRIHLQARSN
jgi:hypothetical protein